MDIISYILSRKYTEKIAASGITSVSTEETSEGTFIVVVYNTSPTPTTIRYKIPTIQGRGIANTVLNADYTLTITYTDGTSYTTPSIRGEKGEKGEKGDPGAHSVSVSPTGTSTNEVNYITIDGVESKLAGGSDVSVSASGTSTNDVRYITIDGTESRFASVALREMKAEWKGSISTRDAATAILADTSVVAGDGFLGTVQWNDLPSDLDQAEVKAFVIKKESGQNIVQFELTSSDYSPYAWYYNSFARQWRTYVPLNNTVTSTSTTAALTANMGKNLQDQITNLQNIGRFLSIWNATIGKPTTDPTTIPYTYRTGDYYRVGVVGGGRHIHQISMNGITSASTGYTASFGFIDETSSSYTSFTNIAKKLYELGHRTTIDGLECSYTIGSTTRSSNAFVYSPNAAGDTLVFEYYEGQSYTEEGRATTVNTATDSVSTAYAHDIDIEGTSTSSQVTYIDHLAFPSTASTSYTTVADIAQVLQRLHYTEDYPCFCGGQVGSTSIYLCYGSGNELVLLNNIRSEVGRITTGTVVDTVTSTGVTNYKPDGTTYTGRASTAVETEELEVGAVYYFDSEKWVLQKSGGGGKVQDVQINGTTIVGANTGIANIPYGDNTSNGVVRGNIEYGSNVDSSGCIRSVKASENEITAKSHQYKVITPNNLNIAIREGLGNNSLTWTDQYKTNARTTIGAIALEAYDSTATPEDGILYYVAE